MATPHISCRSPDREWLVNETARIVVRLEKALLYSSTPLLMGIACEQRNGAERHALLGDAEELLTWGQCPIAMACSRRAPSAETGRLLVDGRRLKAEQYVALWRRQAATPLPIGDLAATHGLAVWAVLRAEKDLSVNARVRSEGLIYPDFGSLQADVGDRMTDVGGQSFEVQFDLAVPGNARKAICAYALLSSTEMSSLIHLTPTPQQVAGMATLELRVLAARSCEGLRQLDLLSA